MLLPSSGGKEGYLAGASPDLHATILHFPKPVTTSLLPSSLKVGFCRTKVQTYSEQSNDSCGSIIESALSSSVENLSTRDERRVHLVTKSIGVEVSLDAGLCLDFLINSLRGRFVEL